jgi:hypothetical protein
MIFKLSTGFYYFKHDFLVYYKNYLRVHLYCTLWLYSTVHGMERDLCIDPSCTSLGFKQLQT